MQAHRLPALQGLYWLLAGLRLFRRNPPLLTALTLGYVFLIIAINLVPLVGPFFLPLALPVLVVVVANGCRVVDLGTPPEGNALTRGVREHRIGLMQLGGLHLLGSLLVLGVSLAIEGGQSPLTEGASLDQADVAAALLRLLAIATPAIMAFWFAPLLTAWDGVPPLKSVFFSFVAFWRNWRAFALYALAVALLAVALPGALLIAAGAVSDSLAQGLSFVLRLALVLVVAPVLTATVYVSYQQVFHVDGA
jgi:hypothetical protein